MTTKFANTTRETRPRRPAPLREFSLAMVVASIALTGRAEATPPDPFALLRGVEASRDQIKSGRMEMTAVLVDPQSPRSDASRIRLKISFDASGRRIDQFDRSLSIDGATPAIAEANGKKLRAMGNDRAEFVRLGLGHWKDTHVRSAYDGMQFMQYAEDQGAYVKDPSKGSADFVFDPRVLGICGQYLMTHSVPTDLAYRHAKSISLVGTEEVAGHPTWHVRVIRKHDLEYHFWIEDSADFVVHKCENIGPNTKVTIASRFDESRRPLAGMPNWVEVREDRHGRPYRLLTITVDKSEYNVPVDPGQWTLAGLGMPIGEMVIDQRIHRVVGHFDGQGLTTSLPDAIRKAQESRWRPLHWGMAFTGLIALAVLAAALVRRRDWLREGEA